MVATWTISSRHLYSKFLITIQVHWNEFPCFSSWSRGLDFDIWGTTMLRSQNFITASIFWFYVVFINFACDFKEIPSQIKIRKRIWLKVEWLIITVIRWTQIVTLHLDSTSKCNETTLLFCSLPVVTTILTFISLSLRTCTKVGLSITGAWRWTRVCSTIWRPNISPQS